MFDTGTTGFMLVATSLVMLMTRGLAFFYGGLACKRNILRDNDAKFRIPGKLLQFSGSSLVTHSVSVVVKVAFIGNLDKMFLSGVTVTSAFSANNAIPEIVFISYQMMFAIITPAPYH